MSPTGSSGSDKIFIQKCCQNLSWRAASQNKNGIMALGGKADWHQCCCPTCSAGTKLKMNFISIHLRKSELKQLLKTGYGSSKPGLMGWRWWKVWLHHIEYRLSQIWVQKGHMWLSLSSSWLQPCECPTEHNPFSFLTYSALSLPKTILPFPSSALWANDAVWMWGEYLLKRHLLEWPWKGAPLCRTLQVVTSSSCSSSCSLW